MTNTAGHGHAPHFSARPVQAPIGVCAVVRQIDHRREWTHFPITAGGSATDCPGTPHARAVTRRLSFSPPPAVEVKREIAANIFRHNDLIMWYQNIKKHGNFLDGMSKSTSNIPLNSNSWGRKIEPLGHSGPPLPPPLPSVWYIANQKQSVYGCLAQ